MWYRTSPHPFTAGHTRPGPAAATQGAGYGRQNLSGAVLEALADHLYTLPQLQALSVANCGCRDIQPVHNLVSQIPPTLTHLNISHNLRYGKLMELTQQQQLSQLQLLDIDHLDDNEYIDAFLEKMLQLNPKTRVHCNEDRDNMWDTYTKDQVHTGICIHKVLLCTTCVIHRYNQRPTVYS